MKLYSHAEITFIFHPNYLFMKNFLRVLILLCSTFAMVGLNVTHGQVAPDYNTSTFGNSVKFSSAVAPLAIKNFGETYPFFFQGNFTIEFWTKVTPDYALGPTQWLYQEEGGMSLGLVNYCTDQTCETLGDLPAVQFTMYGLDEENNAHCTASIPAYNEWFHVSIVVNQTINLPGVDYGDPETHQMNMFINGEPVGFPQPAPIPNSIKNSTKPLYIGRHSRNFFIDELRIWNISKIGMGLRATMNEQTATNINGLVAYYSFNASSTPAGSGANKTFPNLSTGFGSGMSALNGSMGPLLFSNMPYYPEFRTDKMYIAQSGGSWEDPDNWSGGEVPGYDETVTIDLPSYQDELELNQTTNLFSIVFKSGKIRTRGYQLSTSTITAGASSSSYIITDNAFHPGIGQYQIMEAGRSYATLPIGNENRFLPVKIRNSSTNNGYTFHAEARIKDVQANISSPDEALNVPWDLHAAVWTDGIAMEYQAKFHWYEENEGPEFDRSRVYIANYHNGVWRKLGTGAPAELTPDGMYAPAVFVNEFSEFTASSNENFALPVRLTVFSVQQESRSASLKWATTMEENSSHFFIERSNDAKNWISIGSVKASGASSGLRNYTFSDPFNFQLFKGTVYYRLKMVDRDNTFAYSSIRSLHLDALISPYTIYPNPVTQGETKILNALPGQIKSIKLSTIAGIEVAELKLKTDGSCVIPKVAPGIYLLAITGTDGICVTEKLHIAH
jgi:hypothetical protein